MPAIPESASRRLRKILAGYTYFGSHENLVAFFKENESLRPWQNIPYRNDKELQITALISFLQDTYDETTDKNALLTFLSILKDDAEPAAQAELDIALQELKFILSSTEVLISPSHNVDKQGGSKSSSKDVGYDEEFLKVTQAVGIVSVRQKRDGIAKEIFTGTGWLIAPKIVLTCYHVIEARNKDDARQVDRADVKDQVCNTALIFNYTNAGKGTDYGVSELECSDPDLDYAVLSLKDRPNARLEKRNFILLDLHPPYNQQLGITIIHHPEGKQQSHVEGFYDRDKSGQQDRFFHAIPETRHGSSGAPVLNSRNFRAIGMHTGKDEGRSEATKLKAIFDDIRERCPDLYNEIKKYQPEGGL